MQCKAMQCNAMEESIARILQSAFCSVQCALCIPHSAFCIGQCAPHTVCGPAVQVSAGRNAVHNGATHNSLCSPLAQWSDLILPKAPANHKEAHEAIWLRRRRRRDGRACAPRGLEHTSGPTKAAGSRATRLLGSPAATSARRRRRRRAHRLRRGGGAGAEQRANPLD